MGKPFAAELNKISDTISWSLNLNLDELKAAIKGFSDAPIFIVGSGGSLSACYYAANLFSTYGFFAKAITPLELLACKSCIKKSNIILISAGGSNVDILFAFKTALKEEPLRIISVCMRLNTKLSKLAKGYSNCKTFEFNNPAGKDGFLATNSLIAYYIILYRAITGKSIKQRFKLSIDKSVSDFVKKIRTDDTISVIYSLSMQSVAVDIESKFTEAGLGNVLLSDFRNFAHGRHHWFDKRGKKSAIIALVNEQESELAEKTLSLIPKSIPKLVLSSQGELYAGAIDLLIKSFFLANEVGIKSKIDPGKPGVPGYGSKIYNLRYERILVNKRTEALLLDENIKIAILRKSKAADVQSFSKTELSEWKRSYYLFQSKIKSVRFGSVIFDYDGTLCSSQNRFNGLTDDIASQLLNILKKGFVIGVVSGRGKSLRTDLNKIFPEKLKHLKDNVILGYYNGGSVARLTDETQPDKSKPLHPSLMEVKNHLKGLSIEPDESPNQLTFGSNTSLKWDLLRPILLNEIKLLNRSDLEMVESSHSIDIIPKATVTKNNIIGHCIRRCVEMGIATEYLCIGDKGQWPGNDFALLSNKYALSVGEVSQDVKTCWNICPPSILNVEGTKYLLNKIKFSNKYFSLPGL
jgi:DNA-binding MurR/RpiR family transcriptional regulator/hydroxymethylpyrimidine pyrophosphatase-like HAD family hydrolase